MKRDGTDGKKEPLTKSLYIHFSLDFHGLLLLKMQQKYRKKGL